jgi:hypothetical protein
MRISVLAPHHLVVNVSFKIGASNPSKIAGGANGFGQARLMAERSMVRLDATSLKPK